MDPELSDSSTITYPDPTCTKCNTKRGLMFYQGKIECSICGTIVWSHKRLSTEDNRGRQIIDEKNKKVYLNGKLMCDYSSTEDLK